MKLENAVRVECRQCGTPTLGSRNRVYCSDACCNKAYRQRNLDKVRRWGREYARRRRAEA